MHRFYLLSATALIEVGTGLLLLCVPSVPIVLLLGVDQAAAEATFIARVAGAALLSLGAACWPARKDEQSRTATGLVADMFLYNTAVVALLVYAGIGDGLVGIALWPAVGLHTALAVWCLVCFRSKRIDQVKAR